MGRIAVDAMPQNRVRRTQCTLLWAKAEILNPFQCGVSFIPGEERDYECNDCHDQGQVFHQR